MNDSLTIAHPSQSRLLSYLAASVILISALTLRGWQFNVDFFTHPLLRIAKNPVISICFIAGTLFFCFRNSRKRFQRMAAWALVRIPYTGRIECTGAGLAVVNTKEKYGLKAGQETGQLFISVTPLPLQT